MPGNPLDYFNPAAHKPRRPRPVRPVPLRSFGAGAAIACFALFVICLLFRLVSNRPAANLPPLPDWMPLGRRLLETFAAIDPTLMLPPGGAALGLWGAAKQVEGRGAALAGAALNALLLLAWFVAHFAHAA